MENMHILVTGGAGYIGSHTIVELLANNYQVTVADNLSNSNIESINRIQQISGKSITFHKIDLSDTSATERLFKSNQFDAVIHFAGLKAVGESVSNPLRYYRNNLGSTLSLLSAMQKHNVTRLVFSSSATVYGDPKLLPITESSPIGDITNPYGKTKYMIEQILTDLAAADSSWQISILRYFNPIGAHSSGLIGEDPQGIPNNLLPFVAQVAVGKRAHLNIFGNDYPTPDGTAIRDYIHVVDLANGHLAALKNLSYGAEIYNLGTGSGSSVLQIVDAFSHACGKKIPYKIAPRRSGDIAQSYADCTKANQRLNWKATLSIHDACKDAWKWQSNNPNGYN